MTKKDSLFTKHPLLAKSVTAALLASLNEVIASVIARDLIPGSLELKLPYNGKKLQLEFQHPFQSKIPLLALFAFLIQTPFAHYAYEALNKIKYFKIKPLPLTRKLLQILLSLSTITPAVCAINVTFLGIINSEQIKDVVTAFLTVSNLNGFFEKFVKSKSLSKQEIADFKNVLLKNSVKLLHVVSGVVKNSLDKNYYNFLKTSLISSPLILFFAQSYLKPNNWVYFFNFAYFLLGTFQNTMLKLKLNKQKQSTETKPKEEEVLDTSVLKDVDPVYEEEQEFKDATDV